MRRLFYLIPLLFASFGGNAQHNDFASWVNPMVGTGGHGHTFPGALVPFGMVQLSPDTRLTGWDGCSGYHYSDNVIYGFSHTHLSGTGCSDYGDILLMPATNTKDLEHYGYASPFNHKKEHAAAGYYSVQLDKPGVTAELTASARCGMHRYTFPKNVEEWVVVDLKHRDEVLSSKLEVVDNYTLRGYRFSKAWAEDQKVFFEIKFSRPFIKEVKSKLGKELREKNNIEAFQFANDVAPLIVKVAISAVDEDGAHANMLKEMPDLDFDHNVQNAHESWNTELSKIDVKGGTNDQRSIFYTALYHCMSAPNIYSDVDGRYRGRDDKLHNTDGKFDYYTVFSLWDTYRGEHPLLTIIDPKRTNDFINTFIKEFEQGGRLPVWELSSNETNCMIGNHAIPVIWDAYSKGIKGYDAQLAFKAMKSAAMMDHFGLESYKKYGMVRSDDDAESVSKTLEYAYDDWCIAQMARALNRTADYEYFNHRSQNWKNVYDPTTGFMRPRYNGMLLSPFSPYTVDNNFTEANSWQYSFAVQHDIPGLIKAMGGKAKFEAQLDALFAAKTQTEGREQADITGLIGQYAHGNEPSHHIAYLYNYVGKPEKTKAIVKQVLDDFYKNEPDGLIGNEDCGQMSAWYVLSAMGFYPACPGIGNAFEPGYGLFESVTVTPGQGRRSFTLTADKKTNAIVQFAAHRGADNVAFLPDPYIQDATRTFKVSEAIAMGCFDKDAAIYYSLNGGSYHKYAAPFTIDKNVLISFYAEKKGMRTPEQTGNFLKLPDDRSVILHSTYNKQYTAGGADGLVDGIHGTTNWRSGGWQGFQGQDFEGVIVLDQPKSISHITAEFLEDQHAWIFYPKRVSFFASDDGEHWHLIDALATNKSGHDLNISTSRFSVNKSVTAKYIKVVAKNFGPMPAWHEGVGNPTFIFIDEIEVN